MEILFFELNAVTDIGIKIDQKLKTSQHMSNILSKVQKKCIELLNLFIQICLYC